MPLFSTAALLAQCDSPCASSTTHCCRFPDKQKQPSFSATHHTESRFFLFWMCGEAHLPSEAAQSPKWAIWFCLPLLVHAVSLSSLAWAVSKEKHKIILACYSFVCIGIPFLCFWIDSSSSDFASQNFFMFLLPGVHLTSYIRRFTVSTNFGKLPAVISSDTSFPLPSSHTCTLGHLKLPYNSPMQPLYTGLFPSVHFLWIIFISVSLS